jgi:hypothetical protein
MKLPLVSSILVTALSRVRIIYSVVGFSLEKIRDILTLD